MLNLTRFFFIMIHLKKVPYLLCLLFSSLLFSHPLPNTVVNLNVQSKSILIKIQVPKQNFEIAFKSKIAGNQTLAISKYFSDHIQIEDQYHQFWTMKFVDYHLQSKSAEFVGKYDEILFRVKFLPNKNSNGRDFTMHYDAIMHEITNHQALVYVASDWENGIHDDIQQIGIIGLDVPTNTVYPLHISLANGSKLKGFKSMVALGMTHISEGTDHLLFLLVLLLSAPLISKEKKWIGSGGTKYSMIRILKIATAFTIGHSITLIIGAFELFNPNPKPVEILIALSILITAIHAIKPIFSNKEIYVASGFGLIHGLAFASVLSNLDLDSSQLTLSLLGFNLGIELMQLLVIILVMPWFLLLSPFKVYQWVRIIGSSLAGIAALAWAVERYTEKSNAISVLIQNSATQAIWFVLGLACFSIFIRIAVKK